MSMLCASGIILSGDNNRRPRCLPSEHHLFTLHQQVRPHVGLSARSQLVLSNELCRPGLPTVLFPEGIGRMM